MSACISLSFDDGHPLDLRLAGLLRKHGLKATFYVPLSNREGLPLMKPPQWRRLSDMGFEIGGHGLTHARLTSLDEWQARREMFLCRQGLGQALGAEPRGFCFSGGLYHTRMPHWVAQEGYDYCRDTAMFRQRAMLDGIVLHSSLQWYPHGPAALMRHLARRRSAAALMQWLRLGRGGLERSARSLASAAHAEGRPFHLWGHSWEIEALQAWKPLEAFLEFLASLPAKRVDNAGLFDALAAERGA